MARKSKVDKIAEKVIDVINEDIESLDIEELDELYGRCWNICRKIHEIEKEKEAEEIDINYVGKYIRGKNYWGDTYWLHVEEQFTAKNHNDQHLLYLRGNGFRFCFNGHRDDTFMTFDSWVDFSVEIEKLKGKNKEEEYIIEITKEEFCTKFTKIINEACKKFNETETEN